MRNLLGQLVNPFLPILAIVLGLGLSACGSGSSQTLVRVMIDGTGLSVEDRARITSIALTFQDGTDGGTLPSVYKVMGLPTGTFTTVIQPRITKGVLTISAVLNDDTTGTIVATQTVKVTVQKGNQVVATLAVGGPIDGGVLPPADDAATGNGGQGGGAGVGGAGGGAPTDGGVLDLSSLDVGGNECNAKACSGALADGCCPAACTAASDMDCAGCGNGKLDPGETCDPRDTCPAACPP
ncbi:MAG TPA: hypothetical protein VHU40_18490, partial [Polyangia bacterium]|nr:hypothetical protein [Polyangia bacterium]